MIYDEELQKIVIQILTRSVTRKLGIGVTFETSDDEDAFFRELVRQAIEAKLNPYYFYFQPMSNKDFSVYYKSYPIGRIKLNGRKTHMQVSVGLMESMRLDDMPLEEYISQVPKWIDYIKFCLDNTESF